MPIRRPINSTPDLFAAAATKASPPADRKVPPKTQLAQTDRSAPARHLLPKDLPGALTRLDDGEIDALLSAVTDEAKRRGRFRPPTPTATTETDRQAENVSPAQT
jgi:hypothetical protein